MCTRGKGQVGLSTQNQSSSDSVKKLARYMQRYLGDH